MKSITAIALALWASTAAAQEAGEPVTIDTWDARYCELLLIHGSPLRPEADVYNTLGLDDCDQAAFEALDTDAIAKRFGVRGVYKNGPRAWVVSELSSHRAPDAEPPVDFGGIVARKVGDLQLTRQMRKHPAPYQSTTIERDTRYLYKSGRPVFILDDADGTPWVMQAYAKIVDPDLALDDLADLGSRLKLPEGWRYRVETLDADLTVEPVKGVARIVQDDLQNTYDACFETACSRMP